MALSEFIKQRIATDTAKKKGQSQVESKPALTLSDEIKERIKSDTEKKKRQNQTSTWGDASASGSKTTYYARPDFGADAAWKSTIRDSSTVNSEIGALNDELEKLRSQSNMGNSVNAALAAQGRLPGAAVNDNSAKIQELEQRLKLLQEEYDWSQYYHYKDLMQAEDFAEKSKYVSTANGKSRSPVEIMMGTYSEESSGWDDPLYEFINGNQEAGAFLSNMGASYYGSEGGAIGAAFGRVTEDENQSKQMSKDEVKIFNYLYATEGREAAHAYYDYLQSDLNARQREAEEKYWAKYAAENPSDSSVFSVAIAPAKGMSYLGQTMDYLDDGKIDQNASYNKFSYTGTAIREQVSKDVEEKWGKVGSFAYQTGMSMADFLLNTAVTGGNSTLSMTIMGTGAAADATIEAKDRGLSDDQAFALGTIAGAAEAITEKVSLETLLNRTGMGKTAVGYILKNALAEGSEEAASTLINTMADILIAKDKSQWQQSIDAYVADGKTEGEAFGLAIRDQAVAMGIDALGGALSGGIMGGGGAIISDVDARVQGNAIGKQNPDITQMQKMIKEGLSNDSKTRSHYLAQQMQQKLARGESLTNYDLGRLQQANAAVEEADRGVNDVPEDLFDNVQQPQSATQSGKTAGNVKAPTETETAAKGQQTAQTAQQTATGNQQTMSPQEAFRQTMNEVLGIPSVQQAVESYRETGTVSNKQANAIVDSNQALQEILDLAGIDIPVTASAKRAAVKQAVAKLANAETVDNTADTNYDTITNQGGVNNGESDVSGAYEAGLPGGTGTERLRGADPESVPVSGQAPGAVVRGAGMGAPGMAEGSGSGGSEVQLRVPSLVRVSTQLHNARANRGIQSYDVYDTTTDPQAYESALTEGRNSDTANGWCVTPKSGQELSEENVRTFMNENRTVGVGVKPDGDIVAVFKNQNGGPKRALDTAMPLAIEMGGDRLDCYGEGLVRAYENYGFVPVARVEFNPEYANEGWDESKGRPYIYFMAHNGDSAAAVTEKMRTYPHATMDELAALPTFGKEAYDEAMAYRDNFIDRQKAKSTPAPDESVGAAPAGFGGDFYRMQAEYGNLPAGENPVRPDDMPASTNGTDRVSQTAVTAKGAKVTPDEFVPLLERTVTEGGLSYIPIKNSDTVQKAMDYISREGWTQALANWRGAVNAGKSGADLVAQGALLLNNAANAGDKQLWLDILSDYQKLGTNTAQGLQAMRILKTLEPSDKLYMIRRSVDQLVADMKLDVDIVLDEDLMSEYENAETDADRDKILDKIQQNVADQIPSTFMDKFTALRYVNMLGNLRTQVRNIAGNVGMKAVSSVKNAIAAGIEELAYRASGGKFQKTKSFTVSKAQLASAKADFDEVKSAVMNGGRYADSRSESTEFAQGVQDKRTIFKSDNKVINTAMKLPEGYRKLTNWAMEQGDLIFSRSAYARALAGYLKAKGITETDYSKIDPAVMEDARLYSVKEAQEQTFRDTNWLSGWVSKVGRRKDTPKGVKLVSEGIMPFRKTPANVLVRAEEYSPLGILNSVYYSVQAMRGGTDVTGTQVVNSWAKSITGTGIFALGMLLQSLGALTTGPDEDEDKEEFESLTGWQNYALVLPDGTNLTIDFLTPAAMPLLMGAELKRLMDDGGISVSDLESALTSIGEPMVQMSMLQGVSDALDNVQYAENNLGQFVINSAISYLTQGLTNTALGQLERSFESSRMTTYVDKDSEIPAWMQRALGKASAKTPRLDFNQIPYINAWGEEEENFPTGWNVIYNLLSPSYVEKGKDDPLTRELNSLGDATGEKVYPDRAPTYITVDGEKQNLSAEEYVAFAKDRGQTQKKLMDQLIASSGYRSLTDAQKAKAVKKVYEYADRTAKKRAVPEYSGSIARWLQDAAAAGNLPEAIIDWAKE